MLPVLAWAYLELGAEDQAAHVLTDAIRRQLATQDRLPLVDVLRAQAMVALRQRHWAEAVQALEERLALVGPIPYPYGEGRLLQVYGTLRGLQHEPSAARERLEAALAIFRRLGAEKNLERTEQLLTTLG